MMGEIKELPFTIRFGDVMVCDENCKLLLVRVGVEHL